MNEIRCFVNVWIEVIWITKPLCNEAGISLERYGTFVWGTKLVG